MEQLTCQACGHVSPAGTLPPSVGPWEIRSPLETWTGLFCAPCVDARPAGELRKLMTAHVGGCAKGAAKLDYAVRRQ